VRAECRGMSAVPRPQAGIRPWSWGPLALMDVTLQRPILGNGTCLVHGAIWWQESRPVAQSTCSRTTSTIRSQHRHFCSRTLCSQHPEPAAHLPRPVPSKRLHTAQHHDDRPIWCVYDAATGSHGPQIVGTRMNSSTVVRSGQGVMCMMPSYRCSFCKVAH
jgi:hypothetical protein